MPANDVSRRSPIPVASAARSKISSFSREFRRRQSNNPVPPSLSCGSRHSATLVPSVSHSAARPLHPPRPCGAEDPGKAEYRVSLKGQSQSSNTMARLENPFPPPEFRRLLAFPPKRGRAHECSMPLSSRGDVPAREVTTELAIDFPGMKTSLGLAPFRRLPVLPRDTILRKPAGWLEPERLIGRVASPRPSRDQPSPRHRTFAPALSATHSNRNRTICRSRARY
jgi:hypothetical protein